MNSKGCIKIHLKELLEEAGISKTKFCYKTEMQMTQLNTYNNSSVTRLDTDVLSRICFALDCSISDLLEYCKPDDTE